MASAFKNAYVYFCENEANADHLIHSVSMYRKLLTDHVLKIYTSSVDPGVKTLSPERSFSVNLHVLAHPYNKKNGKILVFDVKVCTHGTC